MNKSLLYFRLPPFTMCSYYLIIKSILADLMKDVTATEEISNSNKELSFSSTPDHALPCSADLQFFFSICSGDTPPPSQSPSPIPSSSSPLAAIAASPSLPSHEMNAQLELDHCYDIEESVKASTDTLNQRQFRKRHRSPISIFSLKARFCGLLTSHFAS